jgi:hypothetical protein
MEKAVIIIKAAAVKDVEDLIHDIMGAPEEELQRLGVDRKSMLEAANIALGHIKGMKL